MIRAVNIISLTALVCATMLLVTALSLGTTPKDAAAAAVPAPTRPTIDCTRPIDGEPRVGITPVRFDTEAKPGTQLRLVVTVHNTTPDAVRLRPYALPLQGSRDPNSLVQPASGDSRRAAAARWVAFPFEESPKLDPGCELQLPVTISVPQDARPGTYALAVALSQRVDAHTGSPSEDEAPSTNVRLGIDVTSQAVIRIPGEVISQAELLDVDAPRIVHSGNVPEFRATVENVGDSVLQLDAEINLSAFVGTAGRTLGADAQTVLPDGVRELRMRWSDPPLVGRFRPELVVVGGAGSDVRITEDLPTVYVLPPWWLIALVVGAIALPIWMRRRRRPSQPPMRPR